MNDELKKEMLRSIDVTRESLKNSMEISFQSYTEVLSRLDLLTYLLTSDDAK